MKTNLTVIELLVVAFVVTAQPLPADNKTKLYLPETDTVSAHEHQRELIGSSKRSPSALGYSLTLPRTAAQVSRLVHDIVRKSVPEKYRAQSTLIAKAIITEAAKYGMDPLFVAAVIRNESSFNPEVVGGVGELGLMQIRPTTAAEIAEKLNVKKYDLRKPADNIKLGVYYMNQLRNSFEGHSQLYISAYNMGSAKVRSLVRNAKKPKEYVLRVMKFYTEYVKSLNLVLTAAKDANNAISIATN